MNVRIPLQAVGETPARWIGEKLDWEWVRDSGPEGVKSPLLSLAVLINIYDPCTISILSNKNADEKNLDEAGRGI